MLFVCYTPKFPENPEPNRTNRDLGRSCSVSSRSIGCSSRFGLGLGREVKNLIGIGLNPRTDTEHRAVSVHSQAWMWPKWDGPFVVLEYTDKNTYQLGSSNGYLVRNLVMVRGLGSCLRRS